MNTFQLLNRYNLAQLDLQTLIHRLSQSKVKFSCGKMNNSLHISSKDEGFELEYIDEKLNTIFLYIAKSTSMEAYQYSLPFSLSSKSTIKCAAMVLGQPLTKSKHLTECIYPNLGLGIVFKGSWSNENCPIDYLYLFNPQQKFINVCSFCLKEQKIFMCSTCTWVGYCSKRCKEIHYGHHRIFCDEVD